MYVAKALHDRRNTNCRELQNWKYKTERRKTACDIILASVERRSPEYKFTICHGITGSGNIVGVTGDSGLKRIDSVFDQQMVVRHLASENIVGVTGL